MDKDAEKFLIALSDRLKYVSKGELFGIYRDAEKHGIPSYYSSTEDYTHFSAIVLNIRRENAEKRKGKKVRNGV